MRVCTVCVLVRSAACVCVLVLMLATCKGTRRCGDFPQEAASRPEHCQCTYHCRMDALLRTHIPYMHARPALCLPKQHTFTPTQTRSPIQDKLAFAAALYFQLLAAFAINGAFLASDGNLLASFAAAWLLRTGPLLLAEAHARTGGSAYATLPDYQGKKGGGR